MEKKKKSHLLGHNTTSSLVTFFFRKIDFSVITLDMLQTIYTYYIQRNNLKGQVIVSTTWSGLGLEF